MAVFNQDLKRWDSRDTVQQSHPAIGSIRFIHRPGSVEQAKISVVVVLLGTVPLEVCRSSLVFCPETPKNFPWGFPVHNSSCQTGLLSVSRTDSHGQYLCCVCLSASNYLSTGTGIINRIKVKIYSLIHMRLQCNYVYSELCFSGINMDHCMFPLLESHVLCPHFKKTCKENVKDCFMQLLYVRRLRNKSN